MNDRRFFKIFLAAATVVKACFPGLFSLHVQMKLPALVNNIASASMKQK